MDKFLKGDLRYVGGVILAVGAITTGGIYVSNNLTETEFREPVVTEVWHTHDLTLPFQHLADVTGSNFTTRIPGKTNFNIRWEVRNPVPAQGFTNQFYQLTNQAGFFKVRNRGLISGTVTRWSD